MDTSSIQSLTAHSLNLEGVNQILQTVFLNLRTIKRESVEED